ncbi:MAG: TauD/TfdA family dioxygenase [Myxococcota bacterium]|nr:TauD/TfdA family dioxygenase [Myxococcota bacterium]
MDANHLSFAAQALRYFRRDHDAPCRTPIDAACAWRGADLVTRTDWIEELAPDEIEELDEARAAVRARGLGLAAVGRAEFPLPALAERIASWSRELADGRGFLLVRGLPVERWGDDDSALVYWGIGQHLGEPGAQSTARSGGVSRIVSSVSVYDELLRRRPDLVDRLYEPFALDTRDEQGETQRPFLPIPPCRFANGRLRTFWHGDYFRSALRHPEVPRWTPREAELVALYEEIASDPDLVLEMQFQPGDVQLISNHTTLHARSAYDDWPEPARRRHLLRLWLSLAI